MTIISSRTFNQDTSFVKKQAANGPVIITDRGKPAHVLMTYEIYEKLTAKKPTFLEMIAQDSGDEFDFDIPKLSDPIARKFEFD
jgi:prevent-host-death family protein